MANINKSAIHLIIPCAGNGSRMQSNQPKQYSLINQRPILEHSILALQQVSAISRILLILEANSNYQPATDLTSRLELLRIGGTSRAESVLNGLSKLVQTSKADDWVLVHDAARCLITPSLVNKLIDTCLQHQQGGLLAIPINDTIKQARQQQVTNTLERKDKWLAQTPQMFRISELYTALQNAQQNNITITDEASAIEQTGQQPILVTGSRLNFKITYPEDLELARIILQKTSNKDKHAN